MKMLKAITWMVCFIFLVLVANHFFNPHFSLEINLMFSVSLAMFTLIGIQELHAGRKKIAAIYLFTGAACFITVIAGVLQA